MQGKTLCRQCGRALLPGFTSPCAVCVAGVPPELALNGRWSALKVGTLALICDPLFLGTIFALIRGSSRIATARRYRRTHGHHPALCDVRTEALWGLVLGSLRLWVLAAVLLGFGLAWMLGLADDTRVDFPSEGEEIAALLASNEPGERAFGARQAAEALDEGHVDVLCTQATLLRDAVTLDDAEAGRAAARAWLRCGYDASWYAGSSDLARGRVLVASVTTDQPRLFQVLLALELARGATALSHLPDVAEVLPNERPDAEFVQAATSMRDDPAFGVVGRAWCEHLTCRKVAP
ncbi:MAG: hypothetical protein H6721_33180 [Sandaracinus sp.]|nr:hypothetical protein [Sandaracinus sp.]MCB9619741.1 hypothetical protein [Sandaracinus sp.]MCB9623331.1 hypothetical protein [Sandaracinus sp.]MCB9636987.1 hypothetical protein [Sandaracinus sp.]